MRRLLVAASALLGVGAVAACSTGTPLAPTGSDVTVLAPSRSMIFGSDSTKTHAGLRIFEDLSQASAVAPGTGASLDARYRDLASQYATTFQQLGGRRLAGPVTSSFAGPTGPATATTTRGSDGRASDVTIVTGLDTVRVHFQWLPDGTVQMTGRRRANVPAFHVTSVTRAGASEQAAGDYGDYNDDPCHDAIVDFYYAEGAMYIAAGAAVFGGPAAWASLALAIAYDQTMYSRAQDKCNGWAFPSGAGATFGGP